MNISIDDRIKEHYSELSRGEKRVANYIMNNMNNAALLSCSELANRVEVSDATVTRFAKQLGFNGYAKLKKALRSDVYKSNLYEDFHNMEINMDDQFVASYMNVTADDLKQYVANLDYENIGNIAKLLLNAKKIYLGGLGTDSIVATYLGTTLRKMGFLPIIITEEGHALRESLLNIEQGDVLLMSSYPKMFPDEKEMARLAKESNATLITITDSEITSVFLSSDYTITIPQKNKLFFNSYVIPMAVCNLILLKLYELSPNKIDKSLKHYSEVINKRDIDL